MPALATNYLELVEQLAPGSFTALPYVQWEEYQELLEAVGDRGGLHICYYKGTLEIFMPSPKHEKTVRLIEKMAGQLSITLGLKVLSYGSFTMSLPLPAKGGAEPDCCFYVQNADLIGNKDEIDLSIDPPPDIVVEVNLYHKSASKPDIYADFGVPELWTYNGKAFSIFHLHQGRYVPAAASRVLPMLTQNILDNFLARSRTTDQYTVLASFQNWLNTLPR